MTRFTITASLALLFAPAFSADALARGRMDVYSGHIVQPALASAPQPTIELDVHTRRRQHARAVATISRARVFDAHFRCQNGTEMAPGFLVGDAGSTIEMWDIAVKRGAFSKTVGFDSGIVAVNLTGTLARDGSASGTVRLSGEVGVVDEGEDFGRCDSGTLTWSAARR
jgi:hypothetical protein